MNLKNLKNYQCNTLVRNYEEAIELFKILAKAGAVDIYCEPNSCGSGMGHRVFWNEVVLASE